MRAAIYHTAGAPLRIDTLPDPEPLAGEVIIKVCRCGICASDVQMTSGAPGGFPTGVALGHEYAGEVVAVGAGVQRLRVGDAICAMPMAGCGACAACIAGRPLGCPQMRMMMGGFGEYTRVVERSAFRLPAGVSLIDGALVEPMACSLRAVSKAALTRGDRVLVTGLGAMGLGAIYWARRLGAGAIVASARSDQQSSLAMLMGATGFVLAGDLNPALSNTPGGGEPDVVIECSGAPGMLGRAIDLVRPGGTVIGLGICGAVDSFVPALASAKEVSLRFSLAYDEKDFQYALDVFERDTVQPSAMVQSTLSLDELPDRLESMRQGASAGGKVLVEPDRQ